MKILSLETSCDETAVAVLECSGELPEPRYEVLSHSLFSQVEKHAEFGGVYPNLARREHARNILPLLKRSLKEANELHEKVREIGFPNPAWLDDFAERESDLLTNLKEFTGEHSPGEIEAIAITVGPGLEPALWIGVNTARYLALAWDLPLIPTNHMHGHIFSPLYSEKVDPVIEFPALALLISGGHTQIDLLKRIDSIETLGSTRDDALGEAYDKVGRLLALPYPGGPYVASLAEQAREQEIIPPFSLPRPMKEMDNLDFSFSGLKTAVLYGLRELGDDISDQDKLGVAREFEAAVCEVLVAKVSQALERGGIKTFIIGGGVAANTYLRKNLTDLSQEYGVKMMLPARSLTTDNAIMIGIAGYINYLSGKYINPEKLSIIKALGNLATTTH